MVLDLSGILDEETFHEYVSKKLDFPGYYGFNLDALWDCLTNYAMSNPDVVLRLEGLADSRSRDPAFADRALKCFTELADEPYEMKIEYCDGSPSRESI